MCEYLLAVNITQSYSIYDPWEQSKGEEDTGDHEQLTSTCWVEVPAYGMNDAVSGDLRREDKERDEENRGCHESNLEGKDVSMFSYERKPLAPPLSGQSFVLEGDAVNLGRAACRYLAENIFLGRSVTGGTGVNFDFMLGQSLKKWFHSDLPRRNEPIEVMCHDRRILAKSNRVLIEKCPECNDERPNEEDLPSKLVYHRPYV